MEGLKVLVIDDEEDSRLLLRTILARAGAKVAIAQSASEGMRSLSEQIPDVMLSDIGMPGENGYELMKRVRSSHSAPIRNVPSLAVTAWSRDSDRQMAFDSGFQMHMAKPIAKQDLVAAVAELAKSERPKDLH